MLNTIIDYLIDSYNNYSDKTAIVYNNNCMSYKMLYNVTLNTAGWINTHINALRQPIIVMMKNSDKAIAAFLGIALSRNIYVPLDVDTPVERLKIIIDILQPAYVINCEYDKDLQILDCPIVSWNKIQEENLYSYGLERLSQIIDTDPLYILFTSGSTGTPKGVVISHRFVIDFTEEASEAMKFDSKEVFLNQAPFYFDASVPDIFCTLRNGATLHIVSGNMFAFPVKLMDYISINKINALFWVPSALVMVANLKALDKRDISCLKKIMFCGEVMPTKQLNMWRKVLPHAIFVNYYGPCEATYACSYYIIEREFLDDEPLPIGKAAQNMSIMLISNGKEIQQIGVKGEIYIRGTGVGIGYYNNFEKTSENFIQNPLQNVYPEIVYKTGDLAHYDKDGNIIYDGRLDYQIKHRGYRIELGEIENCVGAVEQVAQTACIYNKDKDMIVCYYSGDILEDAILNLISNKLPEYMIPQKLIRMKNMPLNNNGKIDRLKLKEVNEV